MHCSSGLFGEEIGSRIPVAPWAPLAVDPGSDPVPAMRFGGPLPSQHRADILPSASIEPLTLTVVAVYALPSRTRWSWHRRTVRHSATVHSHWLHQERGMVCLPQSQPLRHCRRFVRNWRPFSSGRVFSDLYLGRLLIFSKFLALYAARLLHICWQRKVVRGFPSLLRIFHLNILKSLLTTLLTDY